MASICINGYKIKVNTLDAWINGICFLWDGYGNIRKKPRNIYYFHMLWMGCFVAVMMLPISWLLSHVPFIWPEALGGMVGSMCVCIGMRPYQDYFRAALVLIAAMLLLHYHVTFDATIFGFHIEKYLYYIAMLAALFTLWRRFFNWFCWCQINRICRQYNIPYYDQKILMDNYEGYDTHYGEKRPVTYGSYQEAVAAKELSHKPIEELP